MYLSLLFASCTVCGPPFLYVPETLLVGESCVVEFDLLIRSQL